MKMYGRLELKLQAFLASALSGGERYFSASITLEMDALAHTGLSTTSRPAVGSIKYVDVVKKTIFCSAGNRTQAE
jgi:hypothetical protein